MGGEVTSSKGMVVAWKGRPCPSSWDKVEREGLPPHSLSLRESPDLGKAASGEKKPRGDEKSGEEEV